MTPEQIEVLRELKKRLNGRCCGKKETCPGFIADPKSLGSVMVMSGVWVCYHCRKYFSFINGFDKEMIVPCPCNQKFINHDEIFILLDEYTGRGPLD